jgi:UV DNA damage repair endonuclease
MSWGLDASLELAQDLALVLDLHHHFIRTGEYLDPKDDQVQRIIDSWRGVRPALHYSTSREDILVGHDPMVRPDMTKLLAEGFKKQKLRAHSDFAWNQATNDWALSFWDNFDIQVEAKGKNLASEQVYNRAVELGII